MQISLPQPFLVLAPFYSLHSLTPTFPHTPTESHLVHNLKLANTYFFYPTQLYFPTAEDMTVVRKKTPLVFSTTCWWTLLGG